MERISQLLLLIIILTSTTLNAQTQKGNIIIGGDFQYTDISDETKIRSRVVFSDEESVFEFNPVVGFYVRKNFILGIGAGIEKVNSKAIRQDDNLSTTTNQYEGNFKFISPYMAIQKELRENFKFDLTISFNIVWGNTEYGFSDSPDATGVFRGFEFSLRPSFFYFLTERTILIGRYGNFGYRSYKEELDYSGLADGELDGHNFVFNYGLDSFRLGFAFLVSRKNKNAVKPK